MFALVRRKRAYANAANPTDTDRRPLRFPDAAAAFQYACEFLACPLEGEGAGLPALVLDGREFGFAHATRREADGSQIAVVRVASADGGFIVNAITAAPGGPVLEPQQLIWWVAFRRDPTFANRSGDERFGWLGFIVGTLKPEYHDGVWTADARFSR